MHFIEHYTGILAFIALLSHVFKLLLPGIKNKLCSTCRLMQRARYLAHIIQSGRCDPRNQNWSSDGHTISYNVAILQASNAKRKIIARVVVSKCLTTVRFKFTGEPGDEEMLWVLMISKALKALGINASTPALRNSSMSKVKNCRKPQTPD